MTRSLQRWLPSLTLAAWGFVLLYFYGSGRLSAFLHPAFRPGVLIAGSVLLLMAVGFAVGGGEACCEEDACGHGMSRMTLGKILAFAVLLLPLSLAFMTGDGFSLNAIQNRGVVTDASELAAFRSKELEGLELPGGGERLKLSIIDLLYAAKDARIEAEFRGRTVEVVGQLMTETEANPRGNRKRLVRMFMNCCAADAKPVGALVEFSGPADNALAELSWVKIVGQPTFPMEGGKKITVLKVEAMEPTDPPDEAMLF